MATTDPTPMTPVDSVPAHIVPFGDGTDTSGSGRVEVAIDAGTCLLTVGRTWAVLDRQAVLDLAHALETAALVLLLPAASPDVAADAHLAEIVDGLGPELADMRPICWDVDCSSDAVWAVTTPEGGDVGDYCQEHIADGIDGFEADLHLERLGGPA